MRAAAQVAAPSFYLHLQPGECFVGAGLWHPEPATQRRIRQFIVDNPGSWKAAAHAPAFRRRYDLESGGDAGAAAAWLSGGFRIHRRSQAQQFRRGARDRRCGDDRAAAAAVLATDLTALAPFVDYLCAALDLEF